MAAPAPTSSGADPACTGSKKSQASSSSSSSRKTKASWRKNIDLTDVEASLEARRTAERLGLAPDAVAVGVSASQINDGAESAADKKETASKSDGAASSSSAQPPLLFVEDRRGDEAVRQRQQRSQARDSAAQKPQKKPLRSLQVLRNDSHVAAVSTKLRPGVNAPPSLSSSSKRLPGAGHVDSERGAGETTTRAAAKVDRAMSRKRKDELRRAAGATVKGPLGAVVDEEQSTAAQRSARLFEASEAYDVWAQGQDAEAAQEAIAEQGEERGDGAGQEKAPVGKRAAEDPAAAPRGSAKRKADKGERSGAEQATWLDATKAKRVKPPPTLSQRRVPASLPAVRLPKPGQSYNPPAESHDELVASAEAALAKQEEQKRRQQEFEAKWRAGAVVAAEQQGLPEGFGQRRKRGKEAARKAAKKERAAGRGDRGEGKEGERKTKYLMGMIVGDAEEVTSSSSDDDEDGEGQNENAGDDDAADPIAKAARKEAKRKTKAQRARQLRAKQQAAEAAARKALKRAQANFVSAKTLARLERRRDEARALRQRTREQRLRELGLRGQRVGKFRLPKSGLVDLADEVQLGEDLSEGLRGLKTEGNLFQERFDSLAARGLAEPRRAVVAKGARAAAAAAAASSGVAHGVGALVSSARPRGRRTRVYDTHAYKRD